MERKSSPEPLHSLIRRMRQPASLRELMASCLRSIYMGDPLTKEDRIAPEIPGELMAEVTLREIIVSNIRCSIYTPNSLQDARTAILYMHGGGFVVGCSEDTDYTTRKLCHSNNAVVVSVNYRLAPEVIFPGALHDCKRVLDYIIQNSLEFGINSSSLFLAGDSAGANLALGLYLQSVKHRALIKGLILLAPWLDMEVEKYSSYNRLAPTGVVFDAAFIGYARAAYLGFEQWKDPLASPIHASLRDLPATIALIGAADPFVDQVFRLKQLSLEAECQQIQTEIYAGMPHCFYSFPTLFEEEQLCYQRIAQFISEFN